MNCSWIVRPRTGSYIVRDNSIYRTRVASAPCVITVSIHMNCSLHAATMLVSSAGVAIEHQLRAASATSSICIMIRHLENEYNMARGRCTRFSAIGWCSSFVRRLNFCIQILIPFPSFANYILTRTTDPSTAMDRPCSFQAILFPSDGRPPHMVRTGNVLVEEANDCYTYIGVVNDEVITSYHRSSLIIILIWNSLLQPHIAGARSSCL